MDNQGEFPEKKIATQVKHQIIENYVNSWGGIIVNSNRRRYQEKPLKLCYVDTCCGSGAYRAPEEPIDERDSVGSPIIALRSLRKLVGFAHDRGVELRLKALFVNNRSDELDLLRTNVAEEGLHDVQIEYQASKFEDVSQAVAQFTEGWFGFVLVDPYGPSATPMAALSPLLFQQRNDCLIYYATNGLRRWAGIATKAPSLRTPAERKIIRMGSAFFGSERWIEIARESLGGPQLEENLLGFYEGQLEGHGPRTLAFRLLFDDQDQTKYHLVFTSRNIAGLYAMKDAFAKGDQYQASLRFRAWMRKEEQRGGLLPLVIDAEQVVHRKPKVDMQLVGQRVLSLVKAQGALSLEEILADCLQVDDVLRSHVRKALSRLRRDGLLAYDRPLRHRSTIRLASG